MKKLPKFHRYIVDFELQYFWKVRMPQSAWSPVPTIDFIPFKSPKGQLLLSRMIREADARSPYYHDLNYYLYHL
jgi:hypothetical protein